MFNGRRGRAKRARLRLIALLSAGCILAAACSGGGTTNGTGSDGKEKQHRSDVFTSPVYGYSIRYPAPSWKVIKATRMLSTAEKPITGFPGLDTFFAPGGGKAGEGHADIVIGAQPAFDMTLPQWTAAAIREVRPDGCHPDARTHIEVDGEPANLVEYHFCFRRHHLWVTLLHGELAFHIIRLNGPGTERADRAAFHKFLASFRFGP